MARTKSNESLDEQIEKAQVRLEKAKTQYDSAATELRKLLEERESRQQKLLIHGRSPDFNNVNVVKISPVCLSESFTDVFPGLLCKERHDVEFHIQPFFIAVAMGFLLLYQPFVEILQEGGLKIQIPG